MKIAFNPSTVAALITPPNNKDITFDLRGRNIFARGVKFCGTDTWRDIKINNVSIGSNILDLRNGSNTTLTNTNGVVTINSTWRPVVDNLTSDSTTSSLSANQGRVLVGLINGKSDSGHTHDDRYLKLTGGTMQLGEGLKFHANENYFGTNADARIISLLDRNDTVCDGGLIIDERGTLDGKEYITELLRIRDSEFKWKGSNILHNGNSHINGNTITINGSSLTVSKSDHTHSNYVTALGTNGNYLTWTKNGSTNSITVPYAKTSSYLTSGFSAPQVNKWDCNAPDRVVYSDYGSSGRSITNAPSEWNYGTLLELGHTNYRGVNGVLNIQLMWDVAHNTTRPGTLWFRGKDEVNGWAKSWAKVITDQNISSILSNYYTKSETDSKYVTLATTQTIGGSKTFTTGIKFNTNKNGDANLGSGDGFKLFYNTTSGSNFPGVYYNVASFITEYTGFQLACYGGADQALEYRHREDNGTWHPWKTLAFTTDIPSSLKNPHALTISLNGTSQGPYDGSAAKNINITPSSIGAAVSNHSHNYAANENYGGFTKSERLPISGFYQSNASESGGNAPWSGWMHLINCQHSNTGNNYALQIAASFSNNNTFKIRVTNNNVNNAWRDIIHSGNIGSQSVAYASKAGSVAWDSITGKPSSFTPSAHTHSWTSITDKLVAGNEFNIVNAGFNNRMWFNYVPINDRSKTATILSYIFGNGHKGLALVQASGFVKTGSSSSYVLLGDGGHKLESSLNVASASVASKVYGQVGDTGSHELVRCDMNNDQFRIIAGSNGNNGWAEIATADDGSEPIYVRQYTGVFSSVKRTLTLLDTNGYTHFPSYINIGGNENNNSSPDRVWGSNSSDSYLRSYRTSALNVNYAASAGNADTVDGYHVDDILPYGLENLCIGAVASGGQTILNSDGSITTSGNNSDTYFFVRSTENLIAGQIYTVGFYVTGVPSGNTATWSFPFAGQGNNKLVINIKSNGWCWGTGTIPEDIVAGESIMFDDSVRGFYSSINISKFVIVKGKQKAYYTPPISKMSVNYANSAGNADTVDGYHANGLLTALSNSNNGISVTVGGTTKSISNISVNHANSAGSANTATKLTSSAGNAALPIYFSDGKPVACTASSVFSNLSNSGNNLSITVAGQNRTLTVGYATSAGSTTKVIVNQHTTNDTNYPLVWSNQNNSNNVTENQLYKSWSDLYYNPKNKRLTVGGSVVASSFIKSDGTSQQLLRADGGIATFNWSGQSGQPTWLWGGNNQHSYYVYNPSNFRVAYATSAGNADTLDGVHLSGIFTAFGNNGHNITATIGGTTKSFLVNWAADSDKLDGYHASDLLTSVTNTNNGISITVGGTTKSVSNISVNYAASAGSASSATQATNLTPENTPHYFRDPSNSIWRGGMYWGNAGSESMSFVAANGGTRFQFVGGSDIANWTSSTWQSVTPYLTIYSSGIVTSGSVTATNGFHHVNHDNNDAVLLAGGGYSQGVPVKYWSIESINIYGPTQVARTNRGGNYTFVTKVEPRIKGSCILTLQFPSGYNDQNTIIWAIGVLNHDISNSSYSTIYATILQFSGSKYYLNLSDDDSLNNGSCQLYFMCF